MKRLLLVLASHALCVPVVGGSIYAPESASGGSFNYGYDTSGNRLTDGQGQVIQMGLRGFAEQIKQGTAELNFRYNPGGQRYVQAQNDGSKKFYLQGGAFEYHLPAGGGAPRVIVYIKKGAYSPIAKVDVSDAANPTINYHIKDHLGSTLRAVNDAGDVVEGQGSRFDPWGQPVASSGVPNTNTQDGNRNFTGHEEFPTFDVVHMNGRILDMHTGLVMQPDPIIKVPSQLPDYSRYVLTVNNPLSFVDPSGYQRFEFNIIRKKLMTLDSIHLGGLRERHPFAPEDLGSAASHSSSSTSLSAGSGHEGASDSDEHSFASRTDDSAAVRSVHFSEAHNRFYPHSKDYYPDDYFQNPDKYFQSRTEKKAASREWKKIQKWQKRKGVLEDPKKEVWNEVLNDLAKANQTSFQATLAIMGQDSNVKETLEDVYPHIYSAFALQARQWETSNPSGNVAPPRRTHSPPPSGGL